MGYVIGVDIGGTFTDCTLLTPSGGVEIGKASSTPPNLEAGFVEAISVAARRHGTSLEDVIRQTDGIYHGCTVGTNALVQGRLSKIGLITTAGHRDSLFMMRAGRRLVDSPAEYIANVARHRKPEPLVPKDLVREVDERIAFDGATVAELNEESVVDAIDGLVAAGVESIAVSLLWAVSNSAHERRIRELVEARAPGVYVSVSSEVMPRVGEYERTVATVINAAIGPVMRAYIDALQAELAATGYTGEVHIMTCAGGLIDPGEAVSRPVLTIGSGPVAGLIGAGSLAAHLSGEAGGEAGVLTADMGGTTFDVGVIRDGVPLRRPTSWHGQYEYFVPTLDVRSVGAGGGSLIGYDPDRHTLQVGPDSAGAVPGPVCYGRGGVQPTVSDADLVLGYLNPAFFLDGEIGLDVEAARHSLAEAGAALGLDADETAAAAVRIVDSQMADAIRLVSIQQGHDPRVLTMFAYGGAGPLHASGVARELGITKIVIPLADLASGWSSFGIASADAVVVEESGQTLDSPFDIGLIAKVFADLEDLAVGKVEGQGIDRAAISLERFADVRYQLQTHELETPVEAGEITGHVVDQVLARFEADYEELYGERTGNSAAGFSIATLRVRASAPVSDFALEPAPPGDGTARAEAPTREVVFPGSAHGRVTTRIYRGAELAAGDTVTGPAVLEYPNTTAVLHPGDAASIDVFGNLVITVGGRPDTVSTREEAKA